MNCLFKGKLSRVLVLFMALTMAVSLVPVSTVLASQAEDGAVAEDSQEVELATEKEGFINEASVPLKKSARTEGKTKVKLSENDPVVVKKCLGIFYKVSVTHKKKKYTGYVEKQYVTLTVGSKADDPVPVVYLTYDDGPSTYIDQLLKTLEDNDVKATFFVTGAREGRVENIKKVFEAGQKIGVHSFSHDYEIYRSEETFYEDVDKMAAIIHEQTGEWPDLYRFPGGSSNTVHKLYNKNKKIMKKLKAGIEEKGYSYADWNVASGDAGGSGTTRERVYENVIKGLECRNESVVLMHDRNLHSVEATEDIIRWGKEHGYEFRTMEHDGFMAHHGSQKKK